MIAVAVYISQGWTLQQFVITKKLHTTAVCSKFLLNCIQNGHTALLMSSRQGHVKVVKILMEKNADSSLCDEVLLKAIIVMFLENQC